MTDSYRAGSTGRRKHWSSWRRSLDNKATSVDGAGYDEQRISAEGMKQQHHSAKLSAARDEWMRPAMIKAALELLEQEVAFLDAEEELAKAGLPSSWWEHGQGEYAGDISEQQGQHVRLLQANAEAAALKEEQEREAAQVLMEGRVHRRVVARAAAKKQVQIELDATAAADEVVVAPSAEADQSFSAVGTAHGHDVCAVPMLLP